MKKFIEEKVENSRREKTTNEWLEVITGSKPVAKTGFRPDKIHYIDEMEMAKEQRLLDNENNDERV